MTNLAAVPVSLRDARRVMTSYRRFLLTTKRKWGTRPGHTSRNRSIRSLIHYRRYIDAYLEAKRAVVAGRQMVNA